MTDKSSKKPLNYLETDGTVHVLWHKLKRVEQLNQVVNKYLDKHLQPYCKATSFVGGKLTLVAANSSIASQLHFQSAELLRLLKQEELLRGINTVNCKVQTSRVRPARVRTNTLKPISKNSAKIIMDIAESIEDPKLREAMKKLARNVGK